MTIKTGQRQRDTGLDIGSDLKEELRPGVALVLTRGVNPTVLESGSTCW